MAGMVKILVIEREREGKLQSSILVYYLKDSVLSIEEKTLLTVAETKPFKNVVHTGADSGSVAEYLYSKYKEQVFKITHFTENWLDDRVQKEIHREADDSRYVIEVMMLSMDEEYFKLKDDLKEFIRHVNNILNGGCREKHKQTLETFLKDNTDFISNWELVVDRFCSEGSSSESEDGVKKRKRDEE